MSYRLADEREHRRGLVLGLTLAEVLLLLLFVLLLALSWRIMGLQKESTAERAQVTALRSEMASLQSTFRALTPLVEQLRRTGGLDAVTVQQLVERLARIDTIEAEVSRLHEANALLERETASLKALSDPSAMKRVKDLLSRAAKIDPNDPPAALTRAVDILDRLGAETKPDQVKALSEMTADAEMRDAFAAVSRERDRFRKQVDNMRKNGLTYPSCWMNAENQSEYMFDIAIYDDGLVVKDATPERANDPAWNLVQPFARNRRINETQFRNATARLFEWSKQQDCRFYTIIRDGTGANSKARYKHLRSLVENHFYPLHKPLHQSPSTVAAPKLVAPPPAGVGGPFIPIPLQSTPLRLLPQADAGSP